ncbi:hypothetical protein FIBSPDRAFT_58109 [Athelia psychrophila]|uniref:Uncharacterized protein n=1 Tax=Athelia psychrophila TaxID=1759441 RepID=A0A166F6U3_9AGAM|nr:hypothetical protein FIBSPDRAFT_58109 [Fibularhizoctonia sp. CBS 109695]
MGTSLGIKSTKNGYICCKSLAGYVFIFLSLWTTYGESDHFLSMAQPTSSAPTKLSEHLQDILIFIRAFHVGCSTAASRARNEILRYILVLADARTEMKKPTRRKPPSSSIGGAAGTPQSPGIISG